jgi:hypothetical protein
MSRLSEKKRNLCVLNVNKFVFYVQRFMLRSAVADVDVGIASQLGKALSAGIGSCVTQKSGVNKAEQERKYITL